MLLSISGVFQGFKWADRSQSRWVGVVLQGIGADIFCTQATRDRSFIFLFTCTDISELAL